MSNFFVSGNSGQIEVAHDKLKNPCDEYIAIICHPHPLYQGSMNNKVVTTISRAMKTLNIESYRFNYRGVSQSQGEYGEGVGESEDLLSVVEHVKSEHKDKKILLCGFSFGGAVAYMSLSKIKDVAGLITVAPSVDRFDLSVYPEPNIPWIVIQGTDDDTVSPESVFKFVIDKVQSELILLKLNNVGHFFHGKLVDLKVHLENQIQTIIKK